MIPRVTHAMAPAHFPVLEQKFAANLINVPTFEHVTARAKFLEDGLDCIDDDRVVHVIGRFRAHIERSSHAKQVVKLLGRIGIDGKWTISLLEVKGDQIRLSMPDDNDLGRWLELEERFWCEERRQGFQILLAILYRELATSTGK